MTLVGIIGGTGDLGTALAIHLAKKNEVLLGSRSFEKALTAVKIIKSEKNYLYLDNHLKPAENLDLVKTCDVLLLTVPHDNAIETIESLSQYFRGNQVLISTVAAVIKKGDEFNAFEDPSGKSFAQRISERIPSSVKIAVAFQTVPANVLYKEREISSDVLVSTDEIETYEKVAVLIKEIEGLRPLYLGSLEQSGEIERLTAMLLNVGKRNKLKSPTLKLASF